MKKKNEKKWEKMVWEQVYSGRNGHGSNKVLNGLCLLYRFESFVSTVTNISHLFQAKTGGGWAEKGRRESQAWSNLPGLP